MAKKMEKMGECCNEEWMWKKKMKIGAGLLVLGFILYLAELGIIPHGGSIWTLAMMLVGIVMIVKGMFKLC